MQNRGRNLLEANSGIEFKDPIATVIQEGGNQAGEPSGSAPPKGKEKGAKGKKGSPKGKQKGKGKGSQKGGGKHKGKGSEGGPNKGKKRKNKKSTWGRGAGGHPSRG